MSYMAGFGFKDIEMVMVGFVLSFHLLIHSHVLYFKVYYLIHMKND